MYQLWEGPVVHQEMKSIFFDGLGRPDAHKAARKARLK